MNKRQHEKHEKELPRKTFNRIFTPEIKWPEVYPVRLETSHDDKTRYVAEQEDRTSQISLAKWLNRITAAGTLVALLGLFYVWRGLSVATRSAEAAQSAANTAHDALVLANRPWIKLSHRIVSPLNFDFIGAAGPAAVMTVEDTIENVGNSVALNVTSWEDVIPLDADMSATTARKRQDDWCSANKKFDPNSPTELKGSTLFPKDPLVQRSGMGPLMSTVDRAIQDNTANMLNLAKGAGPNPLAGKVAFVMTGCVLYRSSFDKDGTRPYMTGFMYRLGEPRGGAMFPFVTPKGIADKLQLFQFPDGFFAY